MAGKHRIIDTKFGEVCIREKEFGGERYCEMYIGDNYDDYVDDIDCTLCADDEEILNLIEKHFEG